MGISFSERGAFRHYRRRDELLQRGLPPQAAILPPLFPHLLAFGVDGFKALELILFYGRSGKRAGLLEPAFGLALVVLIQ